MLGAPQHTVWALGDCAVSGCAPTAQSASQQGKYLGSLFRDTKMDKNAVLAHPDFKFIDKGSLAYLGDGKGTVAVLLVFFFVFRCLMLSYLIISYINIYYICNICNVYYIHKTHNIYYTVLYDTC